MQASFLPAQPFSQPQTSSIPFSYFALTMPNDIACLVVGLLKNSDKLRLLQTCRFWRKMVHLKVKSVQKKRLRNAILHLKTAFDMPMQPLLKIYTNLHIMPSGYNLNSVYNVSQAVLLTIRVQEFRLQNPRSYYHNKRAVTGLRIDVLSPENAL